MEEKTNVKPLNQEAANDAKATKQEPIEEMVPKSSVQGILQQAEMKVRQMVEQMKQMNQMLTDKTIDQLFEVVKHPTYFDAEFVDKCAKCIETYLTNVAFSTPETGEKQPSTEEK